jgi:MATE family multidrug resistance protein
MHQLRQDIKTLATLAWPVIISRIGIMMLTVVDTIMVGRYASEHLAYLGVGLVPHNIFILIMLGLLLGTSVLASRYFGAGDLKKAGEVWVLAMPWALFIGLVGFVVCAFGEVLLLLGGIEPDVAAKAGRISFIAGLSLPLAAMHMTTGFFLEGIRNPRPAMVIMLLANVLNIGANYVLVYGLYGFPELGAEGSTWATFTVRVVQLGCLFLYMRFLFDRQSYGLTSWPRWSWKKGAEMRQIGYASGVSLGIENAAFNALILFAGWISLTVVAAHVIMITAFGLFFMVGAGLGAATGVSVGNAYGAQDFDGVKRWTRLGLGSLTLLMGLSVLALVFFAEEFAGFYTEDAAVIALASQMLVLVAVALILDTGQTLMAYALRARGDTWWPTTVHVLCYAGVMTPVAYVSMFILGRGPLGLVDSVVIGALIPFVILLLRNYYLNRRQDRLSLGVGE